MSVKPDLNKINLEVNLATPGKIAIVSNRRNPKEFRIIKEIEDFDPVNWELCINIIFTPKQEELVRKEISTDWESDPENDWMPPDYADERRLFLYKILVEWLDQKEVYDKFND